MSNTQPDQQMPLGGASPEATKALRESYERRAPSQDEEQQAILRVREKVMNMHKQKHSAKASVPWGWVGGLGTAVAGAAAVFFVMQTPPPAPIFSPTAQVQKHSPKEFSVQATTSSTIKSKHWQANTQGNTKVAIRQDSTKRVRLALQHGFLQNNVTPNTMRSYVVQAREIKVIVKGTRFTVEQRPKWIRVEVSKGVVQVVRHQTRFTITAGRGMRFGQDATIQSYSFSLPRPPCKTNDIACFKLRKKEFKMGSPELYAQYLLDLATSDRLPRSTRGEWLESFANTAYFQKKYTKSYTAAKAAAALAQNKSDRANRLIRQIRACKRLQWNKHPGCVEAAATFLVESESQNDLYKTVKQYWDSLPDSDAKRQGTKTIQAARKGK
jgi:hypothetical protein